MTKVGRSVRHPEDFWSMGWRSQVQQTAAQQQAPALRANYGKLETCNSKGPKLSVLHQIFFKLGSFPRTIQTSLCTCCQLVWVVMNPYVSPGMPRWIDLSGGPSARLHRSAGGRSHAASKRCTTGRGSWVPSWV